MRNDLGDLYRKYEKLRGRIDSLPSDPEFADAIAALALRAMQTSSKPRLDRLALIVVHGVRDNDLEPEGLDDMMRAVLQLTELDLRALQKIYDAQAGLARSYQVLSSQWAHQVAIGWAGNFGFFDTEAWKGVRSSLARLQSFGFIQQVTTNVVATGDLRTQPFGLLPEGARFFERIREIANTSK